MRLWRRSRRNHAERLPPDVLIRNFVTLSLDRRDTWMRDVVAMQAFMDHHNGNGHVVRVAAEKGAQTLFCTCGMKGTGDLDSPLVYREEDLFDSP